VKNRGKKGLIKVLLTDRKKLLESYSNNVFDIEFFQNYFNEDCERYIRYILDNKLIEDNEEFEELAESVGCENILLKILYEEDSQYVVNQIKGQFRYDIVDDGRLILDKNDLGILFDNSYYASMLDDGGIFDDWYPDVLMDDIEEALNEEEKSILSKLMNKETFDFNDLKDTDLLTQLETIYSWSIRQAGEDEIEKNLMKSLQEYFKTKDIIYDETTKGERILSIDVKNFLEDIVFDYFTDGIHEDIDILVDCSNFVCFIEHMIDYHNHYTKIPTPYLDYFYPNHRTIEDLFHEYFSQEIG
jgi:hypothetical protein